MSRKPHPMHDEIVRLVREGIGTYAEIGASVVPRVTGERVRQIGLASGFDRCAQRATFADPRVEEAVARVACGDVASAAAQKVGLSPLAVRHRLRRLGVVRPKTPSARLARIIELYRAGEPIRRTAELLQTTPTNVGARIVRARQSGFLTERRYMVHAGSGKRKGRSYRFTAQELRS